MSGICDTCKRTTCEYRADDIAVCGLPKTETNWERLFGTPERTARTLANVCQFTHGGELCDRCQCYLFGDCDRTLRLMSERTIYDALLEWLRGDAE